MKTQSCSEISDSLIKAIKDSYGFNVVKIQDIYSYFGGVSEIVTDQGQTYILKLRRDLDDIDLTRHDAVVAFCDFVAANITEFVTQKFLRTKEGKTLQHLEGDDYFYIVEKQEIVRKEELTVEEQLELGRLMRAFHIKLKDFKHQGIGDTSWMTSFTDEDLALLRKDFKEEEYAEYIKPLDYKALGLEVILIHGDWHQGNMSFTNPSFIFDLDTLSYGSRVEEIARSVTHWHFKRSKIELYENLVKGYEILPQNEIDLIPKVMVRICYKKYCEFNLHGDSKNANGYKALGSQLKESFNLP